MGVRLFKIGYTGNLPELIRVNELALSGFINNKINVHLQPKIRQI